MTVDSLFQFFFFKPSPVQAKLCHSLNGQLGLKHVCQSITKKSTVRFVHIWVLNERKDIGAFATTGFEILIFKLCPILGGEKFCVCSAGSESRKGNMSSRFWLPQFSVDTNVCIREILQQLHAERTNSLSEKNFIWKFQIETHKHKGSWKINAPIF